MTDAGPPLLVIAGPTASGKTELAVRLAERCNGELIGADSVQVYRGLDVGSAKPQAEELRGVPHHLIDVLDPDEPIDAAEYAKLADAAIDETRGRQRVPIVVGGAGLWLRALLRGLVDLPAPDPDLRRRLLAEADTIGPAALHRRLSDLDSISAASIHPNDLVRIVRALEVFEQTGRSLGELRASHALGIPRYNNLFVVIDPTTDELTPRIERRIATMMQRGWLEETRNLVDRFGAEARALRSVGYRQLVDHLKQRPPLDDTVKRIRKATRVYARRQRTWFRGEPGIDFRGPAAEIETRLSQIQARLLE